MRTLDLFLFIFVYITIVYLIVKHERKKKNFKIDAKPLSEQTLFRLAIIIPVVSFFYFGVFSWAGKTPVISAHGFKRFIEISTLPLGLLSLAIPFTAVINNIHRTIQTNEQIEQTKKKNNLDYNYSYKNDFIKYISEKKFTTYEFIIDGLPNNRYEKKQFISLNLSSALALYKSIHLITKKQNQETIIISNEYINKINKKWIEINKLLKNLNTFSHDSYNNFVELEKNIFSITEELHINIKSNKIMALLPFGESIVYRTYLISNSYLKFLISHLYEFTSDINIYIDNPINELTYVTEYINNPSFMLPIWNQAKIELLVDHSGNDIGYLE